MKQAARETTEVTIGIYQLGHERCEIRLRPGLGGDLSFFAEGTTCPVIRLGADAGAWHDVLASFLHETFELTFDRQRTRFEPSSDWAQDHAQYLFVVPHGEFADACGRVSVIVAVAEADVRKGWEKWQKRKK